MKKRYYFMAGLPRSGSSVLSALLSQHPEIDSGPSSPVLPLMMAIKSHLATNELFLASPKYEQADDIVGNVLTQYYSDVSKPVVIDKNRGWPKYIQFGEAYFNQEMKVICPVRDVKDVLCSFLKLIKSSPFEEQNQRINFLDEQLVKSGIPINDFTRCDYMLSEFGVVGQSLGAIRNAISQNNRHKLLFVEFNDLILSPQATMDRIYNFIEVDKFTNDFDNIRCYHAQHDGKVYGVSGMHKIHPQLLKEIPQSSITLPKQISEVIQNSEIWRRALP